MKEMAERSCQAYRELVYGDPGFVAFFKAATPLEEIARLRLGSRPARRDAGDSVEGLRAIPWVFSWTQARINLPGWFGLGTALAFARERVGLEFLREMERSWQPSSRVPRSLTGSSSWSPARCCSPPSAPTRSRPRSG